MTIVNWIGLGIFAVSSAMLIIWAMRGPGPGS